MKYLFRLPSAATCGLVLSLCLPALAQAATLPVPSAAYPNIQSAVNAASNGDTVLVADGTYTGPGDRDINFGGKSLTVTSQHGAASTIIDCGGTASSDDSKNHRGFTIQGGETAAIIQGLTIENGYEGNVTGTQNGTGGGIAVGYGNAVIEQCIIVNNSADNGGGGVGFGNSNSDRASSTLTLIGCTVASNTSKYGCGGVSITSYNIGTNRNTVTLNNCVISNNSSQGYGGGLSITNVGSTTSLNSCTVTQNTASLGNGIYENNSGGGTLVLVNDIIYGDSGNEIESNSGSTSSAYHCDIQGGYAGSSNLNANPQFVNSPNNLHLKLNSPCLNAGTATAAPSTDKDGRTRPNPPSIGAYESPAPIPTNDDIFLSSGFDGTPSTIEEYTPAGQHVRSIAVPNNTGSYAGNGTEYLRGISVTDAGHIVGFNGTFSPQLTTFFPNTHTFTAQTAPGWQTSNTGYHGSVGAYQGSSFVLTESLNSSDPPASIIRFNPDGTTQTFGAITGYSKQYINLTVGLDGKLYVLYSSSSNGFSADVYDPASLQLLRTVALQVSSSDLTNLTVDASGSIYTVSLYNYVYHLDSSGNLLQSASHGHGGYTDDIKIDPVTGRILISVSGYGGVILQTDASLSSFTTLIQFDPYQDSTNFIAFGNAKLAAALNGTTHLLWKNTGGLATVWTVSGDGSVVSTAALANNGMIANSIADGTDGNVQLLWKSPAGAASVWTIAPDGTHTATPTYGPYGDWQAQALAVGADNLTRLLWKNAAGSCTVWTIGADGTVASTAAYGPYPSGGTGQWQAQGLAVGADNLTRLFWKDTQGEASVWTFAADGTYTATPAFGPYGDWQAQALAVGPDDLTRLFWKNTAGSCTVWTIGTDGIPTSTDPFGPYPSAASSSDWQAQVFAVGADGLTRLFWKDSAGSCTVWSVGLDGTATSTVPYGPYGDWQATALAAGN